MYNIKVVNSYGSQGTGSQALALSASGAKQVGTAHIYCPSSDNTISSPGFLRLLFRGLARYDIYKYWDAILWAFVH
jgi:hypothetical protein